MANDGGAASRMRVVVLRFHSENPDLALIHPPRPIAHSGIRTGVA